MTGSMKTIPIRIPVQGQEPNMACPVVSGIASLLLAKNPNLRSNEVYSILRNSAVTELDWGTIAPPNNQYGYGRVDAFRAILSISRGDVNNDGVVADLSDIMYLLDYSFGIPSGPAPFPEQLLGDANCDGSVDVSDINYLVEYALGNPAGPAPVNPCFEFGD